MARKLIRVINLGTASAMFVLGLAGSALAKHPHHTSWGNSFAGPEMNLGMAANGLLLLAGAMVLLMENHRRHRKSY